MKQSAWIIIGFWFAVFIAGFISGRMTSPEPQEERPPVITTVYHVDTVKVPPVFITRVKTRVLRDTIIVTRNRSELNQIFSIDTTVSPIGRIKVDFLYPSGLFSLRVDPQPRIDTTEIRTITHTVTKEEPDHRYITVAAVLGLAAGYAMGIKR